MIHGKPDQGHYSGDRRRYQRTGKIAECGEQFHKEDLEPASGCEQPSETGSIEYHSSGAEAGASAVSDWRYGKEAGSLRTSPGRCGESF